MLFRIQHKVIPITDQLGIFDLSGYYVAKYLFERITTVFNRATLPKFNKFSNSNFLNILPFTDHMIIISIIIDNIYYCLSIIPDILDRIKIMALSLIFFPITL